MLCLKLNSESKISKVKFRKFNSKSLILNDRKVLKSWNAGLTLMDPTPIPKVGIGNIFLEKV